VVRSIIEQDSETFVGLGWLVLVEEEFLARENRFHISVSVGSCTLFSGLRHFAVLGSSAFAEEESWGRTMKIRIRSHLKLGGRLVLLGRGEETLIRRNRIRKIEEGFYSMPIHVNVGRDITGQDYRAFDGLGSSVHVDEASLPKKN